jgi:hypothetical protein
MLFFVWIEIMQLVCSLILVVLFAATYIRVQVGSKYPLISRIIMLLLICSLFTILLVPAQSKIYQFDKRQDLDIPLFWVWEEGICYFCKDFAFNLAHLNFAFEYYKIAKFMPLVLKGQQVTPQQTKSAKRFYMVLFAINFFFPAAEAVSLIWFNTVMITNNARPDSGVL